MCRFAEKERERAVDAKHKTWRVHCYTAAADDDYDETVSFDLSHGN
jgi:hypothetical protein